MSTNILCVFAVTFMNNPDKIFFCMIYKAILFDLDGTLLDALKDIRSAANNQWMFC